ncbi:MAG: hypothetical protein OHK0045_08890 [Raineya sp.]
MFSKIYVYDNISVELIEGEAIYVEAGEHLLPLIQTEWQADSSLVLRNKAQCNWLRSYQTPVKVFVGAKNLGLIRWESYGNLEANRKVSVGYLQVETLGVNPIVKLNIEAIGLYLFANVGTDFQLSGKTSELGVFMMGYSRLNALDLEAQRVSVRQESSNHIWVKANEKIEGSILSFGNVFYQALPGTTINISSKASGKAIALP